MSKNNKSEINYMVYDPAENKYVFFRMVGYNMQDTKLQAELYDDFREHYLHPKLFIETVLSGNSNMSYGTIEQDWLDTLLVVPVKIETLIEIDYLKSTTWKDFFDDA